MDHVDHRRTRRRRALVALPWLLGSLAGLVGLYVLAVRTTAGQALDTALMVRIGGLAEQTALADAGQSLLGLVSPGSVLLATAVVALLALVVRGAAAATAAVATAAGTILSAQVLKELLVRPELTTESSAWAANSLPSGHVAAVAGLAAGLVIGLGLHARPGAWMAAGAVTGLTGLATVALQWHRPSDVIASALLAVLAAAGAWWATGQGRVVRAPSRDVVRHVPAA